MVIFGDFLYIVDKNMAHSELWENAGPETCILMQKYWFENWFEFEDGAFTCERRHPASDSSRFLGWWVSSHIQIWGRSARPFPSYSSVKFRDIPPPSPLHAPRDTLTPRSVEVGSVHGRRNVATQERKPFVERTCGCWDISLWKAWLRSADRQAAHTDLSPLFPDKRALPRPLVTIL